MRWLLILLLVAGCCKADVTPAEEPKEEAPAVAQVDGLEGCELGEALLKRGGVKLEYVKLALKPETMKELGADEFYAYLVKHPDVLLYVFDFASPEKAEAAARGLPSVLERMELVYHGKSAVFKDLVLVAGLEQKDPPDDTASKRTDTYTDLFKNR